VYNGASAPEATPRLLPQAQAAQQRLKPVPAPPSYSQVTSYSEVRRREGTPCLRGDKAGYIYSALLLIFPVFFSCCGGVASPQAAVWHRPGHYHQERSHVLVTGRTFLAS